MSELAKIEPIGENEAREVINRWSAGGFFRVRNFGDKIFVQQIHTTTSYNLHLRTHYEERVVQQSRKPFFGGPIDDRGRPPGVWEVPVPRPREFEERHEVLPIPHTEHVQLCPQCAGVGRVACEFCQGSGQTTCTWCMGSGFVDRPQPIQGGVTTRGHRRFKRFGVPAPATAAVFAASPARATAKKPARSVQEWGKSPRSSRSTSVSSAPAS